MPVKSALVIRVIAGQGSTRISGKIQMGKPLTGAPGIRATNMKYPRNYLMLGNSVRNLLGRLYR